MGDRKENNKRGLEKEKEKEEWRETDTSSFTPFPTPVIRDDLFLSIVHWNRKERDELRRRKTEEDELYGGRRGRMEEEEEASQPNNNWDSEDNERSNEESRKEMKKWEKMDQGIHRRWNEIHPNKASPFSHKWVIRESACCLCKEQKGGGQQGQQ